MLYPLIAKLLGYRNSFRLGAAVFTIGCILLPLANHISGPVKNNQSDISNSTSGINTTTWIFTTVTDNMITDYNKSHLKSFMPLYGSEYQSQNSIDFNNNILNSVEYLGDNSLVNNSTNNSCHSSRLGTLVGKNSVKRLPARVWLTISWIITMCSIGRLVDYSA